jgi:hypothetical protein
MWIRVVLQVGNAHTRFRDASSYDGDGASYEALPNGLVKTAEGESAVIGLPVGYKLPSVRQNSQFHRVSEHPAANHE